MRRSMATSVASQSESFFGADFFLLLLLLLFLFLFTFHRHSLWPVSVFHFALLSLSLLLSGFFSRSSL